MRTLGAALALAAALAEPAGAEEVLVAAAVSLREPLAAIARRFEEAHPGTRVQLALGASSTLAAQARAGAAFDAFIAADERGLAALAAAGLCARRAGS
jgi:molybdate transport system substrate-binding protein